MDKRSVLLTASIPSTTKIPIQVGGAELVNLLVLVKTFWRTDIPGFVEGGRLVVMAMVIIQTLRDWRFDLFFDFYFLLN